MKANNVRVECPVCEAVGEIRWDRLGRLHVCKGCSRSFRIDRTGGLVEVIQTRGQPWVDKAVAAAHARRRFAARLLLRRALPAVGIAAVVLLAVLFFTRPAVSSKRELPEDLSGRVDYFTRAWLKKDWSQMRLLVRPEVDRELYKWSARFPAPPEARPLAGQTREAIQVDVKVTPGSSRAARIQVRVQGSSAARGRGQLELEQTWERRGDSWYFVVPTRSMVAS
jgi:hypothetical protein